MRELLEAPGGEIARAAWEGERLVARLRLWVLCALVVVAIGQVVGGDDTGEILVGAVGLSLALMHALSQVWLIRREVGRRWLGFASTLGDVTLVTAALVGILLLSGPHSAVNNKVLFGAYYLVLIGTGLRFDPRICLAAGAMAILQYGLLVGLVGLRWDLAAPQYAPYEEGLLKPSAQLGRLLLLGMSAVTAAVITARASNLARLSTRDHLTGLLNRRFLDERLREACGHWGREPLPVAFVLIDADHFKEFNDRHGHATGDDALVVLADVLRDCFRASDTLARYGGEEFAVLMEGASRDVVQERCDRLRLAVAAARVGGDEGARFTVSAGVAVGPDDGLTPGDLIRAADRRLYEAKAAGRNRVQYPRDGWPAKAVQPA